MHTGLVDNTPWGFASRVGSENGAGVADLSQPAHTGVSSSIVLDKTQLGKSVHV